ncbi:MAG: DDE-type integrase/transposase/recombinase [Prevotella sp.]|nr:DDE-type integrase/transposase/recombinase [Prevotella sp.]
MANEESLREQAVLLYLAGKSQSDISVELNRSRTWVYKWISRYNTGSPVWQESHSRAPHHNANQTSSLMEELVVSTRLRLESSPHLESGAYSIWHDISDQGKEPPSIATINRILKRHGLVKSKIRYERSGIEYPEPPLNMHQMDLIGPRYIGGGQRFYLLTIISNDTRYAGVYPIPDKSALEVTRSVVSFWKYYSVPDFLQLDNELSFKGSNRHPRALGTLLRTAMSLNVTPMFIPVSEPWRNGVVERFNQKVGNTLLLQRHEDFKELLRHSSEFMAAHNFRHHYSTLGHKTPSRISRDLDMPMCPLPGDYEVCVKPELDCNNLNKIHFIRLVRSDLTINVLNTDVKVIPSLMHTYVDVVLLVNEHRLLIKQDGKIRQSEEFVMPVV